MVTFHHRMIAVLIAFAFFAPFSLSAKESIRTSLVDVSKKPAKAGYKTLFKYLKKTKGIKRRSQKHVIKAAKRLKIKKSNLRSAKWRKKNAKKLKRLVKKSKVETIMLLDVYSKGRKAQIVTIGPDGKQIAQVKKKIKRGRISKSKARAMLKTSFKATVAALRSEDAAEETEPEAETKAAEEEEEPESDADSDSDSDSDTDSDADSDSDSDSDSDADSDSDLVASSSPKKKKGDYPSLEPGFKINLGMIVGKRDFSLKSTTGKEFVLKHENPYAGAGGQIDAVLFNMGSMAVGASVFGGFAPFTTIFEDKEEFASRFSQFGADLKLMIGFSKELTMNVIVGGEATSLTIDDNPFYTGSRYISARAGLGVDYALGPISLEFNAVVLPILDVNTANGAYGASDGIGIGFAPSAGLLFNITDSVFAGLRYTFRMFPATLKKGPVLKNEDAESTDIMHNGFVSIGYSL